MYTAGYVPDDIAEEMTEPGEAPEERAPGLGAPRSYGVSIPREFEHRGSLQDAPTRFAKFAEMRRTSSAVRIGDRALRTATRQAKLTIDTSDRTSAESAAGMAEQFGLGDFKGAGRLKRSLAGVVAQCLRAETDGAVFLAEKWEFLDGKWWLTDYRIRHVETFTDLYEDADGNLVGFVQQVDGRRAVVPLRACLYVRDVDDNGHFGFGLNRTAEPVHAGEMDAHQQLKAAIRRFANGTPVTGVVDLDAFRALESMAAAAGKDMTGNWMADFDAAMVASVRGLTSSQRSYILRAWYQAVEILEAKFEPSKLEATILARQVEIAAIYAAGFLFQGRPGMSGDQSMVITQAAELLHLADESLGVIIDAINAQTVARWHAYNMPNLPAAERATLGYNLPRPRDAREVADYVSLVGGGIVTPGPEDERYFRATREWPDMPPEAETMGPVERGAAIRRAATVQQGAVGRQERAARLAESFQEGRAASRQGETP